MGPKTSYAPRLSEEEAADLTPAEQEAFRLESATSPLFDMWLHFEAVFGDRAIDRFDISDADADAEAAAQQMEGHGTTGSRRRRVRLCPTRVRYLATPLSTDITWTAKPLRWSSGAGSSNTARPTTLNAKTEKLREYCETCGAERSDRLPAV